MTKYAYVVDGNITSGPQTLPRSWRNISGLNLMEADDLKNIGWLPVVETTPTIDPDTEAVVIKPPVVEADQVTITHSKRPLTAREITDRAENAVRASVPLEDAIEALLDDAEDKRGKGGQVAPKLQSVIDARAALRAP